MKAFSGHVREGFVRRMLRENDLTLVMLGLFMACLIGPGIGGFQVYNQEQMTYAQSTVSPGSYLQRMLVFLTAFLFQIELRSVPRPIRTATEHLGTKCERHASWVYHVLADRRRVGMIWPGTATYARRDRRDER